MRKSSATELYDFYSRKSNSSVARSPRDRRKYKRRNSKLFRLVKQRQRSPSPAESDNPNSIDNAFSTWTTRDAYKQGYRTIGDFYPGSFFGHVALISGDLHKGSIRAISSSVLYFLSREAICTIAKEMPKVGVVLQSALSEAIIRQECSLGKFHMRKNRADTLKAMRNQSIYKITGVKNDVPPSRKIWRGERFFSSLRSKGEANDDGEAEWETTLGIGTRRRVRNLKTLFAWNKVLYDSDEDKLKAKKSRFTRQKSTRKLFKSIKLKSKRLPVKNRMVRSASESWISPPVQPLSFPQVGDTTKITRNLLLKDDISDSQSDTPPDLTAKIRRQSFPSLDNKFWKESTTRQGVL